MITKTTTIACLFLLILKPNILIGQSDSLSHLLKKTLTFEAKYLEGTKLKSHSFFLETQNSLYVEDAKELIYESALLFAREFNIALTMASIADNMTILDEDEANKITRLTSKTEKAFRTSADVISMAGALTSAVLLISNPSGTSKPTFLTLNFASLLPQLIKSFTRGKNETTVDKAINYAHTKAARLAVHAYLTIELKGISKSLNDIGQSSIKIKDQVRDLKNPAAIVKEARNYITLVEEVDRYYTSDLLKLYNSVSDQSNYKIYPSEVQTKLSGLAKEIERTRLLWSEARFIYLRNIETLNKYIEGNPL